MKVKIYEKSINREVDFAMHEESVFFNEEREDRSHSFFSFNDAKDYVFVL
jgi:hypothetical protein